MLAFLSTPGLIFDAYPWIRRSSRQTVVWHPVYIRFVWAVTSLLLWILWSSWNQPSFIMQLYTSVSAESSFSHPICPLFRVFAPACPHNGILCTLIVFMSGFCTRSSVHFLGYILPFSWVNFTTEWTDLHPDTTFCTQMHPFAPAAGAFFLFRGLYQS